ncbi:zinc finger protein 665-like isoform X2 [Rhineura floridana]|uniref:zinc finger protein 665-like isoform X2 n=1 Tax=Rhineura floridana TaxID=261503 RepID=UPI002AC7FFE0|nr:zinc finger protein 665-like isoform X2 [Rhineura floridana]
MAQAKSAQIQQDLQDPDEGSLYREVMQESYNTIFMASPLQLQASELLAHLERGQKTWTPDFQSSCRDADEGLVKQALKKWPQTATLWNSYRSPTSVPSSDSSSSDYESTSEKEEEGNTKRVPGPRVTKPRASLLGKWGDGDVKEEADQNDEDLVGNGKGQREINAGVRENVCFECGKSFSRRSTLNRHLKIHSGERSHKCSTCGKCFLEKSNLVKHTQIHKKKSNLRRESYECPECGEGFFTKASLTEHRKMHTSETTYPCPGCGKSYMAERYLVRHMMMVHSGMTLCKCTACGKGFMKQKDLIRHQMTIHTKDNFFQCPDCGKSYREKSSLIKHQKLHTRELSCKCPECKKSFRDNKSLANHWRMHEKENPHKYFNDKMHLVNRPSLTTYKESDAEEYVHTCPDCGKCFKDKRCFANHQRVHTREQQYKQTSEGDIFKEKALLSKNQIIQVDLKPNTCFDCGKPLCTNSALTVQPKTEMEENLYKCPDCEKIFRDRQCFANHQRKEHQEVFEADQWETHLKGGPYRCSSCGKIYTTHYNLRRHQQIHPECRTQKSSNRGKSFAYSWSFTEHQKAHVKEEYHPHKCSYCGKVFRVKSVLYRHLQIHIKGKPYKCTTCGKAFAYRYTLAHHQEVHELEQPYPHKCSFCGKAFRTPTSLRRHLQLHMGEKRYKCSTCGKAFAYRYALTHHQEIHLEGQLHKCSFCWKTFQTNYSLSRHKRIHMETRSYQCSVCQKVFGTKYSLLRHEDMHVNGRSDNLTIGGKDLVDGPSMAKGQASAIEDNSNNWPDKSTFSRHWEDHEEEKSSECVASLACTKHQSTLLEENSAKGLECEKTFRDDLVPLKDPASHANEDVNKWCENSVYSRHRRVEVEKNPPEACRSMDSSDLTAQAHYIKGLDGDTIFRDGSVLAKDQTSHAEGNFNQWADSLTNSGCQEAPIEENPPESSENGGSFMGSLLLAEDQSTHLEENPIKGLDGKKSVEDSSTHSSHPGVVMGKKRHGCSNCGKCCRDENSLIRHERTHTPERSYQCQTCEKSFSKSKKLARHQLTHTDRRPYPCPECGKCFKAKASIDKHLKTHKGEKPYCCSYCGKRVTTSSILHSHLRIHTGERPYKCTECDKGYTTKSSLKKHLETHLRMNSTEPGPADQPDQVL